MRLASIAIFISLGTLAVAQQPKKAPAMPAPATKPATTAKPAPAATKAPKSVAPAPNTHSSAAKMPAAKVPMKAAAAPKTAPKQMATLPAKKAEHKPSASAKPSAAKTDSKAPEMTHVAGRRDPFISPVRLQDEKMKGNPACSTGARCLVISQVVLKGVVKTQNGMIAMVENGAKKEYNLHERDAVQNGSVTKITGDSIIFQENGTDPLGRPIVKEVVKRVTVPAV
jgi:Tfp pilus assembly protein PilP